MQQLWAGTEQPLVSSFCEAALQAARAVIPTLTLGCLFERVPTDWRERLRRLGAATLHCDAGLVDDGVIAEARACDIPLLCYTVNDQVLASALFVRGVTAAVWGGERGII